MRISLVDYDDTKDLIFHFGKYRQFSFRYYRYESWRFFSRYFFGIRQLNLGPKNKWQRFALDFGKLSLVFENYGAKQEGVMINLTSRVTMTVNYPLKEPPEETQRSDEFHCDDINQAMAKLSEIRGWSSFMIVGVNPCLQDLFKRAPLARDQLFPS